jgi:predicted esterase
MRPIPRKARIAALLFCGTLAALWGQAHAESGDASALRAVVDAFTADHDLEHAQAALARQNVSVGDLLAALREPRPPREAPVPGERTLELKDGLGSLPTDLVVIAPSREALAARGAKPLGLAVLLHGLGGSARQMVPLGHLLAETGDMVAVCPTAQKVPDGMGGEDGVPADGFLQHWWLYESDRSFPFEAIRRARELYAIDPDRVVIAGHSMGGYGSYNISLRHPDRFAGVAPLAGGITRVPYSLEHDWRTRALLGNGAPLPFFVVHGSADRLVRYDVDKEIVDRLRTSGATVEWRPLEGVGHMLEGAWRGAGPAGAELVKFLSTQRRNSSPESVRYSCWGDKLDGAFWLRIAERSSPGTRPDVTRLSGKVDRASNTVTVEGEGVARARVYLDERLLDLSKPVRILVRGATRFEGKVERSFEAVLESWRSREDPALVYPAFVDIDPRTFD